MNIDLQPPAAAAGIRIGATREEARKQCFAHGEPKPFRRGDEADASLVVERPSGLSIFVYFDAAEVVEAVDFGRPKSRDVVAFRDIDNFGTPADALVTKRSPGEGVRVLGRGSVPVARSTLSHAVSARQDPGQPPEGRVLVHRRGC